MKLLSNTQHKHTPHDLLYLEADVMRSAIEIDEE